MKTIYTLLLILISSISFSQDWNLINPNRTVFFQHSDSSSITNTIVIDSSEANGSNTTHYTGYAFKYCDTCQGFSTQTPIIYRYAKELLGFTIEDAVINNQYNLDNNTIKQHTQLNDSWIFNPNLSATVVNTSEQLILGILDSTKTVELSNNDTIIISKNYGVIRYPDFENIGNYYQMVGYHEGQNSFGSYLPNFWRTYDFNVGDIYSYNTNTSDSYYQENSQITLKILSKNIIGDTINITSRCLYSFQYYETDTYPNEPQSYQYYSNILQSTYMVNNENRIENCFGICNTYNESYSLFYPNPILSNNYYTYNTNNFSGVKSTIDPVFGKVKRGIYLDNLSDSLFSVNEYFNFHSYLDFGTNIGLLEFSPQTLSPSTQSYLIGAIINGDTTGTIYNFPDDLGFEENTSPNTLEFYPNPAANQITINTKLSNLKIFNNLGQIVINKNHPSQIIDLSGLPKGLYFIKATDFEDNTYTSKLVIK